MKKLLNDVRLTEDEVVEYLAWAESLQKVHADICDCPLDSMTISFEFSPIGTRVIAHVSSVPDNAPQKELRSDW